MRQRLRGPKAGDTAERDRRAQHPHIQHVWKRDIGRKAAAARQQLAVFEALDRSADQAHLRITAATASTDFRMF
jgi:hypothetical protein